MRYYDIRIIDSVTKQVVTYNDQTGKFIPDPLSRSTYSSHDLFGNFIPGALNVEMDIISTSLSSFEGMTHVAVWGVGLGAISQASDLAGFDIEILGGMKPPYNLNETAHPGQLLAGSVYQCYGNWQGVNQTLDLIVANNAILPSYNANIAFQWKKGSSLQDAIKSSLSASFPSYKIDFSMGPVFAPEDESGCYVSIVSFARSIAELTSSQNPVQITIRGNTIYVYDGTGGTPKNIEFQDLIGQPTWINPAVISFKCVMRGDISLGDNVLLPSGLFPPYVLTTANAAFPGTAASSKSAFQGTFQITGVHHYGNFRQADADSWVTVFTAASNYTPPVTGYTPLPQGYV